MKGVWRDEGVKAVEPTHDEKKSIHDRILKYGMCLACGKQCDDNHARSSAHQRVLKEECQLDRLSAVLHAGSWGWPAAMGFRLQGLHQKGPHGILWSCCLRAAEVLDKFSDGRCAFLKRLGLVSGDFFLKCPHAQWEESIMWGFHNREYCVFSFFLSPFSTCNQDVEAARNQNRI